MSDIYRGMYPFIAIQVIGSVPVHLVPWHRALAAEGDGPAGLSVTRGVPICRSIGAATDLLWWVVAPPTWGNVRCRSFRVSLRWSSPALRSRCRAVSQAQPLPAKPLKFIVPFGPGGSGDTLARLIGQHLSERIGQPVVAENRMGAGGNIGADVVAKSEPDGTTLLMGANYLAIAPNLYKRMSYDPMKRSCPGHSDRQHPVRAGGQQRQFRRAASPS